MLLSQWGMSGVMAVQACELIPYGTPAIATEQLT